ncbi:MAG: lamin tail domain-containing protein [Verrucomicrobia bacterium]|nr:lamin tail domain-containing protein [Verrucomicrobiota bacterium]
MTTLSRLGRLCCLLACCPLAFAAPPAITDPPDPQTIFLGDPATFGVTANGTAPLSYQWFRDGTAIAGATTSSLTFTAGADDDQARFSIRVTNSEGTVTSDPATLTIDFGVPGPAQTNRLVAVTDVWRYHVGKVDLGTAWTAFDYNDNGWSSGGGLLYVEESTLPAPKTTSLPLTPGSLPTTCYFRARFTNQLADTYSLELVANTVVDDGFVLHLNGAEAVRLGMPTGGITYSTPANRTVGNAVWEGPLNLPATNLLAGTNAIAVEVHQSVAGSSDVVMGLTLDAVWQPRLRDFNAPQIVAVLPAAGTTVANLTQIEVRFDEVVLGVDAADLRINGLPASDLIVLTPRNYLFQFAQPPIGPVNVTWHADHGIVDRSANSNAFGGAGFGYLLGSISSATQLAFAAVTQSSDASAANSARMAVDGATTTFSLTTDAPGSYWLAELGRPFPVERIELVNRPAPFELELAGLTLRLFNLDDQVVFSSTLANPGPLGLIVIDLPPGLMARSLWIGLPGLDTNAAGNRRVGLTEVRLFGIPDLPYGPGPVTLQTNSVNVWQSSEYGGFPAENAIDGNPDSFTHTADLVNSYWMADFGRVLPIDRVEIVNRNSCCDDRLGGLVLRIFDGASNSIASTVLSNPGLGATWVYTPAPGTQGRWLRVGLENGELNGGGNYYVTLAETRVFSSGTNVLVSGPFAPVPVTPNLASFQSSYMLRLDESVPAASNANDDNYVTETKTTVRTVDGYWEVDLGATHALYGLRIIAASGIGYRLTNAFVRLYNEAHDSVHARKITGRPDVFDVDLDGPVFARYVRVGLEDKQRTDPSGGIEFYIGFREVEVFGRPTNQVGILSFTASTNRVVAGQTVTLSWEVDDVRRVEIHPNLGSVGAHTAANGLGSVTVPVDSPTEFMLVATNAAGSFSRAVSVRTGSSELPMRLSELVADNQFSLKDGHGDAPDWIELRNPGNLPVNLAGWGLSDNPAQPMKWTFPTLTVEPHGALIIFASGRAEPFDPTGHVHAGFRLEKNGGPVILTASDGVTTVDTVSYPALDTDLAYGRDLAGNWTFLEPTPGAVNAAPTYPGWLRELEWSHARGFYETGFTLTLTNPNPASIVYYSRDGSEPTLPYVNGIPITRTTAIRIRADRPGYRPARIQTKTFLFLDDVIASPVMNPAITQDPAYAPRMRPGLLALPSVSICVPGGPEYEEKEGSLEILWPGDGNPVQVNCGISRFGNAWTKYDKRSIRMKCRARYGAAKLDAPLFNGFDRGVLARASFDELDFRSGSQDMYERGFYMASRFVEDTMLDMGSLNPHGRFVHLYLNGVYWGQYDCRELLVEHFLADYLGGAAEDYVNVRGNDNVGDDFVLGTPDPPHLQPWEHARSVRNSYQTLKASVDVSHLIDFMLLWNYGDCESEFRSCGPIAPGSGFKFWIADADGFLRTSALGLNRTSRIGPGGLFGGLVTENHPDFKTLLADRIYRHFFNNGALTRAANDARLADRMREVHDSLLAECARWGYRTPASWESAAASIRSTLFPTRTGELFGYLRSAGLYPAIDPPTFNQYGGLVTSGFQPILSSSGGTIYYTLDGTDPRLPGGGISSKARVWQPGAVSVTTDLTLNVRVRTTAGAWSALAQPVYLLASRRPPGTRDLWVTEINYNPAGSDDFEFVELWNASTNLLDLSGVSLSNAVHFVFPNGFGLDPGAFVLIVEDTASFADRYQNPASPYYFAGLNVAGQWIGALDNAGESLALVEANGLELSAVSFRPSGDWPRRADGKGSSLELTLRTLPQVADEEAREGLADARNWTASSLYHGSPGEFDPFIATVRINELLSHSDVGDDWIELLNTGSQPVDLTGCALTDDFDLPSRWVFPNNTVLMPGQFLLLTAPELGFAFSELGADAALLRMNGPNVTRILDSVEIPAANRQESLGGFARSDAVIDFTELRSLTPGAPNALPRVGPVVISEIMFVPPPNQAQFLELANLTASPVSLFDPARPTNVWILDGVGSFAFPPNTVLAPCSTLVVCSTDPATFRAQYGVGPLLPVFGPWSGRLDDDGETLKLLQPGTPELDGTVPYYRVDHVSYRTNAPWPTLVNGASLERLPLEAYGNDPVYWRPGLLAGSPGIATANRPPGIVLSGHPIVAQESQLTLTLMAADLDVPWQTVTLRALALPPGSTFDPELGRFSWVPSQSQGPGEFLVRFAATDDATCGALQSELEVAIQVTPSLALNADYTDGTLLLWFIAAPDISYQIEYCTDLDTSNWRLLQEVTVPQNQIVTIEEPDVDESAARFYRVRWQR